MQTSRVGLFACALILGTGCSTGRSSGYEVPAFLSSPDACALVLGGSGTVFDDPVVTKNWQKIDVVVMDAVHLELASLGYRVEKLFLDSPTSQERGRRVGEELGRRRCNRIVQIAHFVDPGARKFGFVATVLGMPPADAAKIPGATRVTLAQEYSRTYSHDLTAQVMQTLSIGEEGRTIARDVDRSGVVTNRGTALR